MDTFGVGADHAVTMAAFRDKDDQTVTIRSINSGDRQKLRGREKRQYANPRAMWGWRLRDRLQKGTITLPDDRELRRQIVELRQSPRNDGLLELEAKKEMSARIGRSPDDLDAVLLGELERSQAVHIRVMDNFTILTGDCREVLRGLPAASVHCCVTSPPYWGLRSYKGEPGMIGLEPTFDAHLENLVAFHEVRRVLQDGTIWLNTGDAYAATSKGTGGPSDKQIKRRQQIRERPAGHWWFQAERPDDDAGPRGDGAPG